MPLNSEGALIDQTPMSTESTDIVQHAPPLYGQHILDQLYADMDQTGLMTPAPQSGMNTPFYSQSRHGSSENLAAFDGAVHPAGAVPPAALSSRLQNLNAVSRNSGFVGRYPGNGSGSNTPHHQSRDSEAGHTRTNGNSGHQSNPLSRRTSEEEEHHMGVSNMTSGQHTPEHIDFSDLGDLTKVPSYATAVKTPVRGMSYSDALPNYDTATSAPPSPQRGFVNPYFAGAETTNGPSPSRERGNPMASLGFTPIHPTTPLHPPAAVHTGDTDEARRLHIIQNRDRH